MSWNIRSFFFMFLCTISNRRYPIVLYWFLEQSPEHGNVPPASSRLLFAPNMCYVTWPRKKVKGSFYCPRNFLLFVHVSFMGLFRIPNNRPNRVPRFFPRGNLCGGPIFSPAMAAAFEDIFNNSDNQFVDICPVSESDDSVIINVPLVVCVCFADSSLQKWFVLS